MEWLRKCRAQVFFSGPNPGRTGFHILISLSLSLSLSLTSKNADGTGTDSPGNSSDIPDLLWKNKKRY